MSAEHPFTDEPRFMTSGPCGALAVTALVLLVAAGVAEARRPPTKSEAAAITVALHRTSAIRRGLCFHVG